MGPQKMEFTYLSDALISLIPTYGPWIIFGVVALESAGVPLPGETTLVFCCPPCRHHCSDQHRRRCTSSCNRCDRRGRLGIHGRASAWLAVSSQIRWYIRLDEDRLLISRY